MAGQRAQLVLAAAIWIIVGLALLVVGLVFLRPHDHWYLALIGAAIGIAKGFMVLDRVADRNIGHILNRPRGRCLGGLYPWRTWLMIAAMVLLGRFLRHSSLSRDILGLVYSAIGVGLIFSSRRLLGAISRAEDDA